jgi:predicted transposase/invertase (TIGR01784 family)
MAERTNPHDEFFKYTLGRPEAIQEFVRYNLPSDVVTLLDLKTVELAPGSFVDEQLRAHHSDLLYKVRSRDGQNTYIYMLFEHKSYPEPQITFQLLKYMMRIWDHAVSAKAELVPIVPIVLYHGIRQWRVARNFQSLLKVPSQLKPYLPEYYYHLYDLSAYSDDEIRGEVWLRAVLLALKYIRSEDLPEKAPGILALLRNLAQSQSGLEHIEAFLRYFAAGSGKMTGADLERAVEAVFPEHGEEIMPTVYEKWVQKGLQEGRLKGRQEGRQEGLLEGIELILDIKFGAAGLGLVPELREIKDPGRLEAVKRVLKTARTPDEVRRVYQGAPG